jgi:hypothetical protein
MNRRRKLKQIFVLITLPLVMFLFFNQVAFWHFHVLDNGIVVEHAHPFKNNPKPGTPFQNHHHTDFEYSVLAQISNAISLLVFSVLLAGVFQGLFVNIIPKPLVIPLQSSFLSAHRLRGPPAC